MIRNFLKMFEDLLIHKTDSESQDTLEVVRSRKQKELWIVVAGKTGVGKSTLFNLLFQPKPRLYEGEGKPGTSEPETHEFELGEGRGKIKYTDMPGIGDNEDNEEEIEKINIQILKKCDLILFLFKCDDTAKVSEQRFFKKLNRKIKNKMVFGLSKIDQATGNWNNRGRKPSEEQMRFILNRIDDICYHFDIDEKNIIEFSAKKKYNIDILLNKMRLTAKGFSDILTNKISTDLRIDEYVEETINS
jgi:small GTP-binding protein